MNNNLDQNSIKRAFNHAAADYYKSAVLQQEIAKRMLERLAIFTVQPSVILDVGCGTGQSYRVLKKRYRKAKVIGVDIAHGMLQVARQKTSFFSHDHYVCADAQCLPFADHSVDMIFSNLMLHWNNHLPQLLTEFARVLKPQGLLFFSTMGPDTLLELRNSWQQVDNDQHVHPFIDMHDIGDCLGQTKFCDPVMEMEMITLQYAELRQLFADLKAWGVVNANQQRRKTLTGKKHFQAMCQQYQQQYCRDSIYPASFEVIYGHAWAAPLSNQHSLDSNGEVRVPITHISKRSKD